MCSNTHAHWNMAATVQSSEVLVKFVRYKVSTVRWRPVSQGSLQDSDLFVTASWDNEVRKLFITQLQLKSSIFRHVISLAYGKWSNAIQRWQTANMKCVCYVINKFVPVSQTFRYVRYTMFCHVVLYVANVWLLGSQHSWWDIECLRLPGLST